MYTPKIEVNMYDDFIKLVDIISQCYLACTEDWKTLNSSSYNLKRILVRDIDFNNELYKTIIEYRKLLERHAPNLILQAEQISNTEVRIKNINSIDSKIRNYKEMKKHEKGTTPIIKSINDLMGIRIVLEEPISLEEIKRYVLEKYPSYRVISSNKNGYVAIHVYFQISNFYFPWELQVWDKAHAVNNKQVHSMYKQEYTKWEKEDTNINDEREEEGL